MASAEAVAAVIAAGGAHVPELMDQLEERLQEITHSHGPVLAEHASATIAAGGKRLRPLLVLLAAGPAPAHPERVMRAMVAVELIHEVRHMRAAGVDDGGDGFRARHQRTVPECRAMIPPAVRIQRTSPSPAATMMAPRSRGAGKRFTELGRYE